MADSQCLQGECGQRGCLDLEGELEAPGLAPNQKLGARKQTQISDLPQLMTLSPC